MKSRARKLLAALVMLALSSTNYQLSTVFAQGTSFTYQGRLNSGGSPASGFYDLQFAIYDSTNLPGTLIAGPLTSSAVAVSNGLFTTTLDFGSGPFNGANRWLDISVRTNGGGAFTELTLRQPLTPTPYAIYSANAAVANGVAPGSITAADIAPGQVLKSLNGISDAATVAPGQNIGIAAAGNSLLVSAFGLWTVNGNAGTSPTNGNFIGTTDFQPLEFKAGGMRVLRLEPDPRLNGGAGNVVGGFTNNTIEQPGSGGNFIGSGGFLAGPNIIHSNSAGVFIGAGSGNQVGPNVNDAFLGAGFGNTIQAADSVILSGQNNVIQPLAAFSIIGVGLNNTIQSNAFYSTIAGGSYQSIDGFAIESTIAGGSQNSILFEAGGSTIGGGVNNTVQSNAAFAVIPGGLSNSVAGYYSMAAGQLAQALHEGAFVWADAVGTNFSSTTSNQFNVRATGGVRLVTGGTGLSVDGEPVVPSLLTINDLSHSNIINVVNGSPVNFIGPGVYGATISGGGALNYQGVPYTNSVLSDIGTIAGGMGNTIGFISAGSTISGGSRNHIQNDAFNAVIAGGVDNTILNSAVAAIIGGGQNNFNAGDHAVVGGGQNNTIQTSSEWSTIGGGFNNSITGGSGVVSGGQNNAITADFSAIGGGIQSSIAPGASYSVIAGGQENFILPDADHSFIGGGFDNQIFGDGSTPVYDIIVGGSFNTIRTNAIYSFIGSGNGNIVQSNAAYAVIPGGVNNVAGGFGSFASGSQARALHDGTFVWSDSIAGLVTGVPFSSTSSNQFLVSATGGVGINTNNPSGAALNVNGTVRATAFQGDGSGLSNLNTPTAANYLFAFGNLSQTVLAGNAFQDITLNNDTQISGWTHTAGNSQYTNAQTGLYLIQYSAELGSSSALGTNATVRVNVNSTEINGSRAFTAVTPNNVASNLVSVSKSIIAPLNAADVLTLQFTGSGSGVKLAGNPCVSLTVTRIQ
jgi:hypothetical protein